tara:strand:+ start:341 stop:784 length:444 start_codon:yes stop_codon:yes gene_type:complete
MEGHALSLEIRRTTTAEEIKKAIGLRHTVFSLEQGIPSELNQDNEDDTAIHVIAIEGGIILGTGRLLHHFEIPRIGRMAVVKTSRGKGIGSGILTYIENEVKVLGRSGVLLHAQLTAQEFYASNGYIPEGSIFEEAGVPHITMKKFL